MERLRVWAIGAVWLCAGLLYAEAPKVVEPYKVYVAAPSAFVRCGPSDDYYRTDQVEPGDELEVYVETEDGWLGVRPLDTSFCWIPEKQVKLNTDGTAAVVEDAKAVAWVGTNLGEARKYRWQVRLMQGEQLAVLGAVERDTKTGEKDRWLKIVPPAGEFRWIHTADTAKSLKLAKQKVAENETRLAALAPKELPKPRTEMATKAPASNPELDAVFEDQPAHEIARASYEAPVGSGVSGVMEQPRPVTPSEVTISNQLSMQALNTPPSLAAQPNIPAATQPIQQATFVDDSWQQGRHLNTTKSQVIKAPAVDVNLIRNADVDQLQLMVSQQMAGEADAASMELLRDRAQWLVQNGPDPIQRGRAGLMLDRIDRYLAVARLKNPQGLTGNIALASGTAPSQTTPAAYDQKGHLVQVYSARPDAPPYAITDQSGTTIAYVAPAPGLNLRHYLNKEVGLYGRTGYLTGLETPYLMVEKVVVLNEVRR